MIRVITMAGTISVVTIKLKLNAVLYIVLSIIFHSRRISINARTKKNKESNIVIVSIRVSRLTKSLLNSFEVDCWLYFFLILVIEFDTEVSNFVP